MKKLAWASFLGLFLAGRVLGGEPAPAFWGRIDLIGAELFGVDTAHSTVGFTIGFLGVTRIRGAFRDYTGAILYDEKDPIRSSTMFVFDVASIDTGLDVRDKDLKGPQFFDAEKYPKIIFQSNRVERAGKDHYLVHGSLKMHGVEREVSFPMAQTLARIRDSAWGNLRVGVSGSVALKRSDYGISGGEFWGRKALSDEVEIEIAILGTRSNFDQHGFDSSGKPSIGQELWKLVADGEPGPAVERYRELKRKSPGDYNFDVDELMIVGNRLLQRRRLKEALEIFRLALQEAPEQTAIQARIGETYAALGDRESALASYRKVLVRAPDNPEAVEMVRRLEGPSPRKAAR